MCLSNPLNGSFYDLTFDGGKRLITILQIYCINDNILERLNNDLIVDV